LKLQRWKRRQHTACAVGLCHGIPLFYEVT
jgi:hypothetical protein